MTTESALIRAIIAKPDDDQPRLTYSDWLEENGQAERAEFIRVQIALEQLRSRKDAIGRKIGHTNAAKIKQNEAKQLAIISGAEWNVPAFGWGWSTGEYKILSPRDPRRIPVVVWRRGFIAEVRCTEEQWVGGPCTFNHNGAMGLPLRCDNGRIYSLNRSKSVDCPQCHGTGHIVGIGPRIATAHPVERVVITDRKPMESARGTWTWWSMDVIAADPGFTGYHSQSNISTGIFNLLKGHSNEIVASKTFKRYPTEQAALDAYSQAAIEWARGRTCVGGYHVATTEDACTTTSL